MQEIIMELSKKAIQYAEMCIVKTANEFYWIALELYNEATKELNETEKEDYLICADVLVGVCNYIIYVKNNINSECLLDYTMWCIS